VSDMNFAGGTMSAMLVRVRRNDDEDEALFILMCISIIKQFLLLLVCSISAQIDQLGGVSIRKMGG